MALAPLPHSKRLTGDDIGTVLTYKESRVVVALPTVDRERRSRLHRIETRELPSSQNVFDQQAMVIQEREPIDEVGDRHDGIVQARRPAIMTNVVRIADARFEGWITRTANIRIVRPGEVGLKLQPMREVLLHSYLQCVVAGCSGWLDLNNLGEVRITSYVCAIGRIHGNASGADKAARVLVHRRSLVERLGADIRH